MRRGTISTWIERLMEGDPLALGVAGFFGLLVIVVMVFFLIDLRDKMKDKANPKTKAKRPR